MADGRAGQHQRAKQLARTDQEQRGPHAKHLAQYAAERQPNHRRAALDHPQRRVQPSLHAVRRRPLEPA